MIKRKSNKTIRIAAISLIAAFSLISCFTGVYAWFNANTDRESSAENIKVVNSTEMTLDNHDIYEYDFEKDYPAKTDSLVLHGYDCFVESQNEYNKKYVVVNFTFPFGIPANKHMKIDINAPTDNYFDTDEVKVTKNVSNLIQFKFFNNSSNTIPITGKTDKEIYDACRAQFKTISDYDNFVTDTVKGTKSNISNTSLALATSSTSCNVQIIIEYTYDEYLIEVYKNRSGVDYDITFFKEKTVVKFAADISLIAFGII